MGGATGADRADLYGGGPVAAEPWAPDTHVEMPHVDAHAEAPRVEILDAAEVVGAGAAARRGPTPPQPGHGPGADTLSGGAPSGPMPQPAGPAGPVPYAQGAPAGTPLPDDARARSPFAPAGPPRPYPEQPHEPFAAQFPARQPRSPFAPPPAPEPHGQTGQHPHFSGEAVRPYAPEPQAEPAFAPGPQAPHPTGPHDHVPPGAPLFADEVYADRPAQAPGPEAGPYATGAPLAPPEPQGMPPYAEEQQHGGDFEPREQGAAAAFAPGAGGETEEIPAFAADQESPLEPASRHAAHRRRRRRPGASVLAAASVVGALGAGLLTTQTLTDGRGDDRAFTTDDHALPELPDQHPSKDSASPSEKVRSKDGKPSPSASASKTKKKSSHETERADRSSDTHTKEQATPDAPSTSAPSGGDSSGWHQGEHSGHHDGGDYHGYPPYGEQPPQGDQQQPSGQTLRQGDRGPEVVELQRRLKQAGALPQNAPEDGVYSQQVYGAVAVYQAQRGIQADPYGTYGPTTRQALESETHG